MCEAFQFQKRHHRTDKHDRVAYDLRKNDRHYQPEPWKVKTPCLNEFAHAAENTTSDKNTLKRVFTASTKRNAKKRTKEQPETTSKTT